MTIKMAHHMVSMDEDSWQLKDDKCVIMMNQ